MLLPRAGALADRIVGDPSAVVHPDDREALRDAASRVLAHPERPVTVVYRCQTARGTWRVFSSLGSVREGAGGKRVFVLNTRDITERTRLDEERANLERQVRQTQKLETVGVLAGGIAHDFNNLLAPILGYAGMLRDRVPADSEEATFLERIVSAGKRSADLVKRILSFSRQRSDDHQAIDLAPVVDESLAFIRASIPSTIEIEQSIAREPCVILGDATQIQQVLMNLFANAACRDTRDPR